MNTFTHTAFALALLPLVLMTGCLLGPDYQRPELPQPDHWAATNSLSSASLTRWWESFQDPLLTNLVSRAFDANLDLQQAAQRVRQGRAVLRQVGSGLYPTLDAAGSYSRKRSWGDSVTDTGWNGLYSAGLDAAWELDVFGGVRREIEATEADFRAIVADQRGVYVTLAAEVANAYFALRMQQEILRVTQDNLATQERSARITRDRRDSGWVSGLDVANAEAQLNATRSQIPSIQADIQTAILAIELLLAQLPGALHAELSAGHPFPFIPADVPAGLPSELLERRPDVLRAEAVFNAATARIGVAKADLFPKFTILASANLTSEHLKSWTASTRTLSVLPGVSLPLFNAGRLRARVDERQAYAEEKLYAYQQAVLTAFSEVEDSWQAFLRERERAAPLAIAVQQYARAVDIATELYNGGEVDYTDVLIAQRALLAIQDSEVRSHILIAQRLIALYKALGGGWEN